MKILLFFLSLILLSGCAYSGYSPSYIISDAGKTPDQEESKGL